MQLTLHSDYALRLLIYLAQRADGPVTVAEVAGYYRISRNHLMKVAHGLVQAGFVHSSRGKGGGLRLARSAGDIVIGEVVRTMEPNLELVQCVSEDGGSCQALPVCRLPVMFGEALESFFGVLDRYTLEDVLLQPQVSADSL